MVNDLLSSALPATHQPERVAATWAAQYACLAVGAIDDGWTLRSDYQRSPLDIAARTGWGRGRPRRFLPFISLPLTCSTHAAEFPIEGRILTHC